MEWINVKTKMPKKSNIDILINVDSSCFMGRYDSEKGWMLYFSDVGLSKARYPHITEITHWMPLPEPPKTS